MPRTADPLSSTEPPKKRPKIHSHTEEDMAAACAAKDKVGLREAAKMHGVPVSTLRDRLKGRIPNKEVERTFLSKEEEQKTVDWIVECARRGFGCTMPKVQAPIKKILDDSERQSKFKNNMPGQKWTRFFLKRHLAQISSRTPQGVGTQRAAVIGNKIQSWFANAQREIQEVGGGVLDHPSRIFNCDESGFQLGGSGFSKVLASKKDKYVYRVTSDTHTQITVLVAGSTPGQVLKPMLIFPGQRFNYNPLEGFPEAHFARSKNGWIDSEIFALWLRTVFVPATEHLLKPVVRFADGHSTHATMTVSDICRDHNIILYQLPSHSSHIVQPLDLTTFKKLKDSWRKAVSNHMEENCDVVGKKDFSAVFKKAWDNGIDCDNVVFVLLGSIHGILATLT